MSIDFTSRIKKEMTEGIVRAILEDAGYRVIDSGIEKVLRELSCLNMVEYLTLGYPDAMSHLPDFTVMDRDQKTKYLVEVKYRKQWGKQLFLDIEDQVKIFKEIILISVNSTATDKQNINSPARYLRCCCLRYENSKYEIELRTSKDTDADGKKITTWKWVEVSGIADNNYLWWSMSPLQEKFPLIAENKNKAPLFSAIQALAGILEK